jgi:hypothetical protein
MEFPESIQHTQVVGCAVVSAGCMDPWNPAAPDARQRTSMSQRVHARLRNNAHVGVCRGSRWWFANLNHPYDP